MEKMDKQIYKKKTESKPSHNQIVFEQNPK